MDGARVSVVVPTYQRRETVVGAVESVLAQDYEPLEVVVVDDGSTDGTIEELTRRYRGEGRVRVFRKENGGTADARNHGIDRATGDFIAFLDSDDAYLPGYLAAQAERLAAAPGAAMSLCDAKFEGAWGEGEKTLFERFPKGLPDGVDDLVLGGWLLITCMTFRAPVIRALRFAPGWHVEDTELLYRFFAAGHSYVVEPRPLVVYRKHAGERGVPQKTDDWKRVRLDSVHLARAYAPACGFSARVRGRLHRRWAKKLTEVGRHREARADLLRWWRLRPFQWRAPWMLLSGAFRRDEGADRGGGSASVPTA